MKIHEGTKKCVAFMQLKLGDGSFKYAGTCFFVLKEQKENKFSPGYIVTAKHVIDSIKSLGLSDVYIRLNLKSGGTEIIQINISKWFYHTDKTVDIAVNGFLLKEYHDHLYYGDKGFLNNNTITSDEIDCGDEVFITGLFKYHYGDNKNLPIVRIGNIAMMKTERVKTGTGDMDAYLIESRSIGGLSGSPVFVNLGSVRRLGGVIKHAQGNHIPPLLGIIHGHYDSRSGDIDYISDSNSENEKINVGIAIVTPVEKLNELLTSKEILDYENNELRK